MKLNAWLKRNPSFSERLQVVERLAQALNAVHDRGEPLAALDLEHVEVDDEGDCDISPARRGNPAAGYGAPERAEGGPPSPEADIYAAGAIAWEVLAGRPYATAPSHLAEASREVPRELADAVMACLEQSPQWRPRDLTYIAQLAQHNLGQGSRGERSGARTSSARPAARPSSSRSVSSRSGRSSARTSGRASPVRMTPLHEPRSHAMLAVVAGAVVVVAGAGYFWMTRAKGTPATTAAATPQTTVAPAALTVTARPDNPPATSATPVPLHAASTPPPVTSPAAYATPFVDVAPPRPAATPPPQPPVTMARPLPPPVTQPRSQEVAVSLPPPVTQPAVVAPIPTTTTTTIAAAPALPRETPVLSTVSPLSVRRPGKFLLDLHGSGFRPDLRVRVVPLKEAPHGITVMKQVCKSPTLFQVLIDLDTNVNPGAYAVTLADASGRQTTALTFTVVK